MQHPLNQNTEDQYTLGLGLNDLHQPVCLVLSVQGMAYGATAALAAEYYVAEAGNLRISGAAGSVMLKHLSTANVEACVAKLPLIVVDHERQLEHEVLPLENGNDVYGSMTP